ncbi:hypothetical protein TBLA_0A06940 [Henningerozyma blattae CBS 6284]|uniref:Presequence protease, mitochondrial n=1 Tax=Henningerozyma blattae (strain ATCC 34711 / CBS 6284 / DSM 70876 / NBRC 10599 / NRRL Y-10934 / UCD 77-7) TaxID=1071380 RepID=I2GWI3_HENB6|nr:hypothetical protein TBLA_0A06940 [Tetrapisispora blattae CBS 6284]CCH58485.1 hypothetical protein TBLA_0A06940 [Tetrapisispora blattae CBS 6284]
MLRFRRFSSTLRQTENALKNYKIGDLISGYQVNRVVPIPELQITAIDLIHSKTASKHLHIDTVDTNNVFCVGFKTNPPDSTGVAHILEHTTLCGSKKYPVRDPFFKMLNRSLSNFMNAMTGHDYTMYPFATTNSKDFKNLQDVYLDATFSPLLKQEDFFQEGWRLENKDATDKDSDLIFKGVVYNEMKGQNSNADYYFWSNFLGSIYPSLNNSGGDPKSITTLKYEGLKSFHKRNYHPSNSLTYSYGNFPMEDTLNKLNEKFLQYDKEVHDLAPLEPTNLQNGNINISIDGQFDPMLPAEKQTKISISWICGNPKDTYETFILRMFSKLLIGGHSSPMYQRLIESGIGMDYSVNTGVESITSVNLFNIGVQGVEDIEKFKEVVFDVLKNFEDFGSKKIEGILKSIEIGKKQPKSNFGMEILYSILPGWVNGIDPLNELEIDKVLTRFRTEYEQKGDDIFRELVSKYIIGKNTFTFSVKGNEKFQEVIDEEEKIRLNNAVIELTEKDRKDIFERGKILVKKQEQKDQENIECLPTLKISDISRLGIKYDLTNSLYNESVNIQDRLTNTNGLTYVRSKQLLNKIIPVELYKYLPIFASSLTHLGTTKESYGDIEDEIKFYTGGVSMNVNVISDPNTMEPNLYFKMKGLSLNNNSNHIFNIWNKLLYQTDFQKNSSKLKVLIRNIMTNNGSMIVESGHSFARGYAGAFFRTSRSIHEAMNGIEQIKFINHLNDILDNEKLFQEEIIDKLIEIQKILINDSFKNTEFLVTSDTSSQIGQVKTQLYEFVKGTFSNSSNSTLNLNPSNFPLLQGNKPVHILIPAQVSYGALSLPGVSYTNQDGASLQVLSQLLTTKYLHKEIREKGGAYGGGATYDALSGIFNFYSYRDPNPIRSMDIFADVTSQGITWDKRELDEAKMSIFQSVDAPVASSNEGLIQFYSNIDNDMRQHRREQLLDVTLPDIDHVAEKYLANAQTKKVVLGPSNDAFSNAWDEVSL